MSFKKGNSSNQQSSSRTSFYDRNSGITPTSFYDRKSGITPTSFYDGANSYSSKSRQNSWEDTDVARHSSTNFYEGNCVDGERGQISENTYCRVSGYGISVEIGRTKEHRNSGSRSIRGSRTSEITNRSSYGAVKDYLGFIGISQEDLDKTVAFAKRCCF